MEHERHIGKCFNISRLKEVGFYGDIFKLYDGNVCNQHVTMTEHAVGSPQTDETIKKETGQDDNFYGLNVWEILTQYCCDKSL